MKKELIETTIPDVCQNELKSICNVPGRYEPSDEIIKVITVTNVDDNASQYGNITQNNAAVQTDMDNSFSPNKVIVKNTME